ncbi:DELTA-thalatoxin-Avl1a-like [Chanos chanos]|uniref:DELTA-thalatoxin-Avl1a-like n=1 Tax=Chanos chanos TaxID=29144 RepID=A0A6J2UUQ5_CHACN|nr:DELTA-thalatoxin-Avl1a-like [Chanos chanos]
MDTLGAMSSAMSVSRVVSEISGRSCTIKLENHSEVYSLVKPRTWMNSGYNSHPPSPTVDVKATEVCAFSKTAVGARGAVGVLTYDLLQRKKCTDKMMAIMFSVPFDYSLYENWLAVGVFEHTRPCDDALFNLMYYDSDPAFIRAKAKHPSIVYTWESMEIRAVMSNAVTAITEVEIHDKS